MPTERDANLAKSLDLCSLFESEVLVWLMLRNWEHPLAEDADYRNELLEGATEVLRLAISDPAQILIAGMPSSDLNIIAAIWYAEVRALEELPTLDPIQLQRRNSWLQAMRKSLPSCFCAQDRLPQT